MESKMSEHSAIVLAAGTAITMACIKRIMVMLFAEQWRTKVFLLLNVVLLAIFYTSVRSSSNGESSKNEQVKVGKMKRRKSQSNGFNEYKGSNRLIRVEVVSSSIKEEGSRFEFPSGLSSDEKEVEGGEKEIEVEEGEKCWNNNKLTKEELNERAEAFIAMFRQHLALDARQH